MKQLNCNNMSVSAHSQFLPLPFKFNDAFQSDAATNQKRANTKSPHYNGPEPKGEILQCLVLSCKWFKPQTYSVFRKTEIFPYEEPEPVNFDFFCLKCT